MSDVTELLSVGDLRVVRLSNFEVARAELKQSHRAYLRDHVARTIKGGGSVTLIGLASRTGNSAMNQGLSERRNQAVLGCLQEFCGTRFKAALRAGFGEQAAALAGVPDGYESKNWRAVVVGYWPRNEPPPIPQSVTPPPKPAPTIYKRVYTKKTVMVPDQLARGVEGEPGERAFQRSQFLTMVANPDAQVIIHDSSLSRQLDDAQITKIWLEAQSYEGSSPIVASMIVVNFEWGRAGRNARLLTSTFNNEESMRPEVAREVYDHPAHLVYSMTSLYRHVRQPGTSGWFQYDPNR